MAKHRDGQVITFIIGLCFLCGLILAVIAYSLSGPQEAAKTFDQSKQMLIAANLLNHEDIFQDDGKPAKYDASKKILIDDPHAPKATDDQIRAVAAARIRPLLTDKAGKITTFKEANLSLEKYLADNKKNGYANLPLKLFYAILKNTDKASDTTAEAVAKDPSLAEFFVIPISGFGLWAPIYGYIAIQPNGDTVVGTTWYDMGETPGLGANIAEAWWQNLFPGKLLFHLSSDGKVDFKTAEIGIVVVKGKVQDVYGDSPRAKSAVDGISGATLTGDGVTAAYKDSLTPYRNFLIKLHEAAQKETK